MSDELVQIIQVVKRPPPMSVTLEPKGENQPFLVAGCGHKVHFLEELTVDGRAVRESNETFKAWQGRLPRWLQRFIAPKQCMLCQYPGIFESIIACAYCGEAILFGDPVSCYLPAGMSEGFDLERATQTPMGFVGCMGWDCCPTAGFFAGHWVGEGIRSPFNGGSAAAHALSSGDMVVVSNIDTLGS